jgi:hypothetical protein
MPVQEVKINPSRWSPSAGRYPEILNQHFSDGQGIRAMIGREDLSGKEIRAARRRHEIL